ncbi:hypothetical protein GCM10022237_36320 [Nocardioides ginsengisoli]|uniref:Uncharacterized protein n=1 Tax=Nocardioides ginsengisoli TaxID=363868 RepID=A0ABW3W168_9ACTN
MSEDDEAARRLLPVADAVAASHAEGRLHGTASSAPDEVRWLGTQLSHAGSAGRPGWLAPLHELAMRPDPAERPTAAEFADYLRARVAPPSPPLRPRRSPALLVLAGAAVVTVFGVVGAALLFTGGGNEAPAETPSRAEPTADTEDDEPTATRSAEPVTARRLERFARDYVTTASSDAERGFRLLTRDYQGRSPRYREVWTAIQDPEILSLDSDPATLTVRYTYRYRLPGGARRTEEVTLQLVQRGGRLLIAGATARPG